MHDCHLSQEDGCEGCIKESMPSVIFQGKPNYHLMKEEDYEQYIGMLNKRRRDFYHTPENQKRIDELKGRTAINYHKNKYEQKQ